MNIENYPIYRVQTLKGLFTVVMQKKVNRIRFIGLRENGNDIKCELVSRWAYRSKHKYGLLEDVLKRISKVSGVSERNGMVVNKNDLICIIEG